MDNRSEALSHKQRRTWFIPALIAAVSFIGGLASNLLASDLEGILKSYRIWVWLLCIAAFIIAIVAAIRDRLQSDELLLAQGRAGQKNLPGPSVISIQDDISKVYITPKLATNALHQLPPPPHDFTGREAELGDLMKKMQQEGVVISALRGQGGVGKTTLALKLAEQLKDVYPDGQFYLDLRGADSQPMPIADALAYVIRAYHPGVELPEGEAELRATYLSVLHNRRALLLMDNARDKKQVEPLIPPAGCALLVTSRQHFTLPGLYPKNLDSLSPADACKLLLTIAPRIGDQAEELARLCGYLPLALRLAASVIAERPNIKTEDYIRRLASEEKRLELVEASLNLSYELLSAEMQGRWRALAVFPNTFDEAAAAAVWEIEDEMAQECLSELFAFSFVEWNDTTARYRLHDLLHVFADSRMSEAERESCKKRHAAHYRKVLATANDLFLKGGKEIGLGLALFDTEWGNISAGQSWAATRAGTYETATELCISYPEAGVDILNLRQHPRERIQWLGAMRKAAQRQGQLDMEGRAISHLGVAYVNLGEMERAIGFYEQSLASARAIGDRREEGLALQRLGFVYYYLGKIRRSVDLYEQSLAIVREICDRRVEGHTLRRLGTSYLGEPKRAIEFSERAVAIIRETEDQLEKWSALNNLGQVYSSLGEAKRAIEYSELALTIARDIGHRKGEGEALKGMGIAYTIQGDTRRAIEFFEQSLTLTREIGDCREEGRVLGNLGEAYCSLNEIARAFGFYEQALAITREACDRINEGRVLWNMALAFDASREWARAIASAEEALVIYEQIESPHAEMVRNKLAELKGRGDESGVRS